MGVTTADAVLWNILPAKLCVAHDFPPLPAALDRRGSATRIKNAASVLSFSDSVRGDCVCSFAFLSVIDQLLRKIGRSSFDRLTGMKCSPTDMP
jgi:hypothetical protein